MGSWVLRLGKGESVMGVLLAVLESFGCYVRASPSRVSRHGIERTCLRERKESVDSRRLTFPTRRSVLL